MGSATFTYPYYDEKINAEIRSLIINPDGMIIECGKANYFGKEKQIVFIVLPSKLEEYKKELSDEFRKPIQKIIKKFTKKHGIT